MQISPTFFIFFLLSTRTSLGRPVKQNRLHQAGSTTDEIRKVKWANKSRGNPKREKPQMSRFIWCSAEGASMEGLNGVAAAPSRFSNQGLHYSAGKIPSKGKKMWCGEQQGGPVAIYKSERQLAKHILKQWSENLWWPNAIIPQNLKEDYAVPSRSRFRALCSTSGENAICQFWRNKASLARPTCLGFDRLIEPPPMMTGRVHSGSSVARISGGELRMWNGKFGLFCGIEMSPPFCSIMEEQKGNPEKREIHK